MKPRLLAVPALVLAPLFAQAADFVDFAPVVSVTPFYERVSEPREECWTESAPAARDRSLSGPIIGGIAGGILGSQVGKGNGNKAATAAGAVVGTIVGDRVGNADETAYREIERCRTVDQYRETVTGYDVVYRYQGRQFTTRLPYDPGRELRLHVKLDVAENAPPPDRRGEPRRQRRDWD